MKKFICLVLTLFVLCGCSKFTVEDIDWDKKIEDKAFGYVFINYKLSYDANGVLPTVTTIKETNDNEYEVYGTVRCTDNYGKVYEAKWNGIAYVNLEIAQKLIDEGAKKDDGFGEAIDFNMIDAEVPRG